MTVKRKSDPHWRKKPSQSLEARRQRVANTANRRNEIAQALGYPNSGALLAAICAASEETRAQIRLLLTPPE